MAGLAAFPTAHWLRLRMPSSSFLMLSSSSSLLLLFSMMSVASDSLSALFLSALHLSATFSTHFWVDSKRGRGAADWVECKQ